TTPEASFRRYRLGQWVGAADSWLPWGAWDECTGDPDLPDEGTTVVLAFDGSASGDSTALIGCTVPRARGSGLTCSPSDCGKLPRTIPAGACPGTKWPAPSQPLLTGGKCGSWPPIRGDGAQSWRSGRQSTARIE